MSNAVSKFTAVILALVLMYIYPAAEAFGRQDDLSRILVYNEVTQFVDAVRNKGYLTPVMYREFLAKIQATGNEFDVQMEHLHKKYNPEYGDTANPSTFQNAFSIHYQGYYTTDIMTKLFPELPLPKDDAQRMYKLAAGDFFTVTVKNINRTPAMIMFDFITGSLRGDTAVIAFPYGGMVLNEDY